MKDSHVAGKKWPEMVITWPFMGHNFSLFFLQNCKNLEARKSLFFVIAFDLIKIIRSWASQNDCQILIFVKAIYIVGETMTRNSGKMVKS